MLLSLCRIHLPLSDILNTTRPSIAASSTTVKLLTVSTVEDSVIFWHSKLSSGVLERPIPKSDSKSRDSS